MMSLKRSELHVRVVDQVSGAVIHLHGDGFGLRRERLDLALDVVHDAIEMPAELESGSRSRSCSIPWEEAREAAREDDDPLAAAAWCCRNRAISSAVRPSCVSGTVLTSRCDDIVAGDGAEARPGTVAVARIWGVWSREATTLAEPTLKQGSPKDLISMALRIVFFWRVGGGSFCAGREGGPRRASTLIGGSLAQAGDSLSLLWAPQNVPPGGAANSLLGAAVYRRGALLDRKRLRRGRGEDAINSRRGRPGGGLRGVEEEEGTCAERKNGMGLSMEVSRQTGGSSSGQFGCTQVEVPLAHASVTIARTASLFRKGQ